MLPKRLQELILICTLSFLALFAVQTSVWSQSTQSSVQMTDDLKVLLVDTDSLPVQGARIGFSASFGDNSYESPSWIFLPDPATQERYPAEVVSDERGIATFKGGKTIARDFRVGLVARHEGRHLVGIGNVSRSGNDQLTMTLFPECVITGSLECLDLQRKNIGLVRNRLNVTLNGQLVVEHYSNSSDFQLFLSPGKYSLTANGADGGTLTAERPIVVPDGIAEMKMFPIQLSLKRSRDAGRPAPELTDVIAWKGDGPRSIRDLKGKVVLLDFWGYWCQACLAKIPRLIELDNLYRQHGLAILGLHVDAGNRITSIPDYDAFVEGMKSKLLNGKDIPYPVALIAEKSTPFVASSAKNARCEISAAYGVDSYPSMILIDRDGNIVGAFRDTPEDLIMLRSLLGIPESEGSLDR
ncbi:MAG: TlpA family protein disulfide reductase [Planctomycetales bacterium]|nr:TlpA family protein disulfide reductase [Planctomycetales bacterium]